eukprot:scaffold107146_cov36-Phaeocystis_antarctica.AAC.2
MLSLLQPLGRRHRERCRKLPKSLLQPRQAELGRRHAQLTLGLLLQLRHALLGPRKCRDALWPVAVLLEPLGGELDSLDSGVGHLLARVLWWPPAEHRDSQPRPLHPVLAEVPEVALHAFPVGPRIIQQVTTAIHNHGAVSDHPHARKQREEAQQLKRLRGRCAVVSEPLVSDLHDPAIRALS